MIQLKRKLKEQANVPHTYYCFGCYRDQHLFSLEGFRDNKTNTKKGYIRASRGDHEGYTCTAIKCGKCKTRYAERFCNDCDSGDAEDEATITDPEEYMKLMHKRQTPKMLCKSCFLRVHRSPLLAHHTFKKI